MDASSVPLADYFWIAGVESVAYDDGPQSDLPVDTTIAEDGEPENSPAINGQYRPVGARHSRQNSANRLSKISLDGRSTTSTLEDLDGKTRSNRSSATIRPGKAPLPNCSNGQAEEDGGQTLRMGDVDFDRALIKFAAEREDFLDDLTFSAGARVQARPPMVNPRAERIRADDGIPSGRISPLKSLRGSIRRKISFKEMSSSRKQNNSSRAGASSRAGLFASVMLQSKLKLGD